MDDQEHRRLELRMSVEASPEAPADELESVSALAGGGLPAPLAREQPVPVTACTTADDAKALAAGMMAKANPAEWMFDRLSRMIEDFEDKLTPEEEIGATIVGAPGEGAFRVDDIGFWGPDLIMFYGKNMHGRSVRLIQHYQQLSILLTALPRQEEKPARRIGFALRNRLEEAASEEKGAPPAPPPTAQASTAQAPATAKTPTRGERP